MSTVDKVITCKAAVVWEADKPFVIEEIQVQPPKAGEVRIKIIASGVCHSDCLPFANFQRTEKYPIIRGHEGAGIVESVGEGVTDLKTGDHVLTIFTPQCKQCVLCKSSKTNVCIALNNEKGAGVMSDGTSRFTCRGKPIYHFFGTSSFSQYTVASQYSVIKINENAPLDKVALLACGISTGLGSAINVAKVELGSTCAIWGLGAVGMAVAMGCRIAGASKIYGIDLNSEKFELGKKFGITHFVNPKDVPADKPLQKYLHEITGFGFDYTFECVGKVEIMQIAIESSNSAWGKTVLVGVDKSNGIVGAPLFEFISGRTLTGALYGGWRPKDDIPQLVEQYMSGKIMVDEFITHNMKLDKINDAFDLMLKGQTIHTILHMHD